jgi:glyoxylase-like metal-dependent hydrolase (beta-lactamase superfamily II)
VADEETKKAMVIDPGAEAETIMGRASHLGLDIKQIVLTHGHVDHMAALNDVKEASGAGVAVHEADVATMQDDFLSHFIGIRQPEFKEPERLLKDGDEIKVGGLTFNVIHTPGHTPGGICLYGEGALFSGDTLFFYGIGRSDFPGGDGPQLLKSIRSRLFSLPEETKVYPGHGPDTTVGAERRGNPFLAD